jgi:hypothetical protein
MDSKSRWSRLRRLCLAVVALPTLLCGVLLILGLLFFAGGAAWGFFGDVVDEYQSRQAIPQFEKLGFRVEYYSRRYGSKMAPRSPAQIDKAAIDRSSTSIKRRRARGG